MTVVASGYARQENDLYQTEPWATRALLRHLPVSGATVWEPSAGNHKIADVLRAYGATTITSDIVTYDRTHDAIFDFLKPSTQYPNVSHIITNPPYGKSNVDAVAYARLALKRCAGFVALLMTAKFDFGKTRKDLFADNPRYHLKIALVDRIQFFPSDVKGTESHAWYVWKPTAAPYAPPSMAWEGKDAYPW